MMKQIVEESPELQVGTKVKDDFANKALSRVRQINESQDFLLSGEAVLGIFATLGGFTNHIVITNHRIFSIKAAESNGNVVFANELTGGDLRTVKLQAAKGLFNTNLYHNLKIHRDGKESKYATIYSTDAESVNSLLGAVKPVQTMKSLIESQESAVTEEIALKNLAKSRENEQQKAEHESKDAAMRAERAEKIAIKQAKLDEMKKEKQLNKQAKKIAKQDAKDALNSSRGRLLGKIVIDYTGGYDSNKHSGMALYLYEGRLEYRDWLTKNPSLVVNAKDIGGFTIGGRQEIKSRFTVTRMLTLGVFALAAPKRTSIKEATVTVSLKDGRQLLFHTKSHTEYEVHKKLISGISHYSKIKNDNTTKTSAQASESGEVDLLEKYAALHKKGILTDEEFRAKKNQILGL